VRQSIGTPSLRAHASAARATLRVFRKVLKK